MKEQIALSVQSNLTLIDVIPNWEKVSSVHTFDDVSLRFGLLEIAPQVAAELLKTQQSNRKSAPGRVLEYARRQEEDEWTLSDAIKFDEQGCLIDGQHRLMAVTRSGISLPFPIISGYPKHSQSVLDIGMNRTVAQIGQIQGLNASANQVSLVRAFFLPLSNVSKYQKGVLTSPQKVLELLSQHQEAIEFASKRHGSKPVLYAPVRAMVARAWYHENRKRLEEFLYVFDTGFSSGSEDSAAVALRNVVLEMRAKKTDSGNAARVSLSNKACSAIEAFLTKEERKMIREKSACKWKVKGVDA